MFFQTRIKTAAIVILLGGLAIYASFAGYYGRELVIDAAALIILAISLDLVAGYGGMVSLCHGALFGVGAYVFASMTAILGVNPWLALPVAVCAGALFGFVVGAVTARTSGIFFIMATLAFGEMAYVYIFENRALGGDDGMSGVVRLDASWLGVDLNNSLTFAIFAIVLAAIAYVIAAFVLRSAFGRTLVGIHSNEQRMRALGLNVWRYKAGAFAISGALAGLAGTVAAQQTMFVSPQMLSWVTSGETLVVVILGGLGTLVGPAVGAVLVTFLEHQLSNLTAYWHMMMGLVLILVVLLGNRGAYGLLEDWLSRKRKPVPKQEPEPQIKQQDRAHA